MRRALETLPSTPLRAASLAVGLSAGWIAACSPAAESGTAPGGSSTGLVDQNGNPITGTQTVDQNGNTVIVDGNGNQILTDENGMVVVDENNMAVTTTDSGQTTTTPSGAGGAAADTAVASGGAATATGGATSATDSASGGAATNAGAGGAADSGSGATPDGLPGVVVLQSFEDQIFQCSALCSSADVDTGDDATDDWGYEGYSCVFSGTPTGGNQTCTTGGDIPPPTPKPGVVVSDSDQGTRCEALCQTVLTTAADPDENPDDGWYWEDNRACVIPDTLIGGNQACTTGDPLPPPESRPGIILDAATCTPLCQVSTEASDPDNPDAADWGYENNESCVLPGTPTATDKTDCETNVDVDYTPPATGCAQPGFYVDGASLRDGCGEIFVMRGVNNPHYWADIGGAFDAYKALDDISAYGTNTIRVVWETGESGTPALLEQILYRIVQLQMIPMVELHDVTGETSDARLLEMAQYYIQPEVLAVLVRFREYLLVNIANEWSGDNFQGAYSSAIQQLRDNGVEHTLVIDANGFGQNGQILLDSAAALLAADPLSNLLFSVHMYGEYADAGKVTSLFSQAKSSGVPLIVGEFGHQHSGQDVAWQTILSEAQSQGIGWIAWSWFGNDGDVANLNMVTGWGGSLTAPWGQGVMQNIQQTAKRASVF